VSALALGLLLAQAQTVRAHAWDLPAGLELVDVAAADADGDGVSELWLGCDSAADGPNAAGAILILKALRGGGYGAPLRLDLTPDVVAWAPGDVHADAGLEVVLLGAAGAVAWRPRAAEAERFVKLADCAFLWQLPAQSGAFLHRAAVRDVDGDGLDDLLCPEPDGYRLALQRRDAQGARFEARELVLPHEIEPSLRREAAGFGGGPGARTLSIRLDDGGQQEDALPQALLRLTESVPAPQWVDWDADGRLDLAAQSATRLHLWTQGSGGAFGESPAASFALPVEADLERRLDASYRAFAADLDLDRRADVAVVAGDPRSEDVRTQVLVFTSAGAAAADGVRNPFGEKGVPRDLLVLAGFVASAEFVDLDGDGYPEFVAHTVRPDLIDAMRSAASETIETELFVYRNERGRIARRPSLSWRYTVPIKEFSPWVEFVADVSGDGLCELFVRDQPSRARLHLLRAGKEGWSVLEKPLWEGGVAPAARVAVLREVAGPARALVLLEETRLTHLGLGR
jgi:hypothetical protein